MMYASVLSLPIFLALVNLLTFLTLSHPASSPPSTLTINQEQNQTSASDVKTPKSHSTTPYIVNALAKWEIQSLVKKKMRVSPGFDPTSMDVKAS